MLARLGDILYRVATGIASLIAICLSLVLFVMFLRAISDGIGCVKWDLTPPSSTKELMGGLFLAAFVGFALAIGFTGLFGWIYGRWKRIKIDHERLLALSHR